MSIIRRKLVILNSVVEGPGNYALRPCVAIIRAITGKRAYVAQVEVWLPFTLSKRERKKLCAACIDGAINPKLNENERNIQRYKPYLKEKWALFRPTAEAFILLQDIYTSQRFKRPYFISRTDIALDVSTETNENTILLKKYIDRHLIKRWIGKQDQRFFETTTYYGKPDTFNNICIYIKHGNVCHVEWRINGTQQLARKGINTFSDLIKLDAALFWKKHLQLKALHPAKFKTALVKSFGEEEGVQRFQELRRLNVQKIITDCRLGRPDRLTQPIDPSGFMP